MVLKAPQPGQRPIHFGVSVPQEVQKKTVFALAMSILLEIYALIISYRTKVFKKGSL
jgi:hypothetical protein